MYVCSFGKHMKFFADIEKKYVGTTSALTLSVPTTLRLTVGYRVNPYNYH